MEFALPLPGSAGYIALCAGAWITGASAAAWVVFGLDNRRADRGGARVPESTLLWIAGLGGWPGALMAQRRLERPTHRRTFAGMLHAIVLMQTLTLAMLLLPQGSLMRVVEVAGAAVLGDVRLAEDRGRRFGPKADIGRAATVASYLCRGDSC